MEYIVIDLEQITTGKQLEDCLNEQASEGYHLVQSVTIAAQWPHFMVMKKTDESFLKV